jgi:enoyl-CoA hydratase
MEERYAAFPSLELDRPAPHVLRLTLRAPGRLNAVSGTMHGELAAVWRAIGEDDETRAVIVRGADGAFSAGGDLDLVLEIASDYETRRRFFH